MRSLRRWRQTLTALAVALIATLPGSPGGSARAGDVELTPGMKQAIDESLFVFTGEVIKSGLSAEDAGAVRQTVDYKVVRVLKGACLEAQVTVEHGRRSDGDAKTPDLDRKLFAPGVRLVLGVQLRPVRGGMYSLVNSPRVVGVQVWSQEVEKAISEYAGSSARAVQPDVKSSDAARDARDRATCVSNLTQLAQLYLTIAMENRTRAQRYSGPSLWLQYRKKFDIPRGRESALLCPCDLEAHPATSDSDLKAWDSVDLDRPATGLCSYAGRDFKHFPVNIEATELSPIGACLHHPGGVVIAYDSGKAEFVTLEQLGLASDDDKVVGPESKSRMLRVLR